MERLEKVKDALYLSPDIEFGGRLEYNHVVNFYVAPKSTTYNVNRLNEFRKFLAWYLCWEGIVPSQETYETKEYKTGAFAKTSKTLVVGILCFEDSPNGSDLDADVGEEYRRIIKIIPAPSVRVARNMALGALNFENNSINLKDLYKYWLSDISDKLIGFFFRKKYT